MAVEEKHYPESLTEYLKEQMQNPEFAREFEKATRELDFALSLAKLREEQGLTQNELGLRSGVPQETISRIERGRIPAIPTLKRLAKALHASVTIYPDERVVLQAVSS